MIAQSRLEEQAYLNTLMEHLGITDTVCTNLVFMANGWIKTQPPGAEMEGEQVMSLEGFEYLLTHATQNTEKLSDMVEAARQHFRGRNA